MNEKFGISVILHHYYTRTLNKRSCQKLTFCGHLFFIHLLFYQNLEILLQKKCLLGPTKYRSFQACPFLLSKLVPQDAFQGTISAAVSSILLKSILNGGGLQAPVILGVDISNTSWNIDTWTRTYWCPIIYVLYNSGMYLEIRYNVLK